MYMRVLNQCNHAGIFTSEFITATIRTDNPVQYNHSLLHTVWSAHLLTSVQVSRPSKIVVMLCSITNTLVIIRKEMLRKGPFSSLSDPFLVIFNDLHQFVPRFSWLSTCSDYLGTCRTMWKYDCY